MMKCRKNTEFGATLLEYSILATAIAVACVSVVMFFGLEVVELLQQSHDQLFPS